MYMPCQHKHYRLLREMPANRGARTIHRTAPRGLRRDKIAVVSIQNERDEWEHLSNLKSHFVSIYVLCMMMTEMIDKMSKSDYL